MTKKFKYSKIDIKHSLLSGLTMGIIITSIYLWNLIRYGWSPNETYKEISLLKATTMTFILIAIIQIIHAFNVTKAKKSIMEIKYFANPYLILTTIISILIIYATTSIDSIQKLLKITSLNQAEWKIIAFATVLILITEEIKKIFLKKYT